MLLTDYNFEDHLAVAREEAREDGLDEGLKKGQEQVLNLMEQGYSPAQIKVMLSRTPSKSPSKKNTAR
ncbi:hypothetical protein AGMMS49546_04140 [Spirochaetia bacterium]|nr:hypothetical protein AGMMS49546_04140 [Spirochaetia bacterium]